MKKVGILEITRDELSHNKELSSKPFYDVTLEDVLNTVFTKNSPEFNTIVNYRYINLVVVKLGPIRFIFHCDSSHLDKPYVVSAEQGQYYKALRKLITDASLIPHTIIGDATRAGVSDTSFIDNCVRGATVAGILNTGYQTTLDKSIRITIKEEYKSKPYNHSQLNQEKEEPMSKHPTFGTMEQVIINKVSRESLLEMHPQPWTVNNNVLTDKYGREIDGETLKSIQKLMFIETSLGLKATTTTDENGFVVTLASGE